GPAVVLSLLGSAGVSPESRVVCCPASSPGRSSPPHAARTPKRDRDTAKGHLRMSAHVIGKPAGDPGEADRTSQPTGARRLARDRLEPSAMLATPCTPR